MVIDPADFSVTYRTAYRHGKHERVTAPDNKGSVERGQTPRNEMNNSRPKELLRADGPNIEPVEAPYGPNHSKQAETANMAVPRCTQRNRG